MQEPIFIDLSNKTKDLIESLDTKLNAKSGWNENPIKSYVNNLLLHKRVEVGWRESCGTTDPTMHVYRAWIKVLKRLRSDGLSINEERIKHDNAYATNKGGFWNSIVYTIET
jgi:hypothetical protein